MVGLILPVACFCFLLLALFFAQHSAPSFRRTFLLAALAWGVLVVLFTELLSLFQALTSGWVLLCWTVAMLAGAGACLHLSKGHVLEVSPIREWKVDRLVLVGLLLLAALIGTLGLIALVAAPNTWDSMTYHLSRVMHWQQDRSVLDYPTNIERQLFELPGAEFIVLQFQLLVGSDQAANLVQWFSMVGSVLGVSLIAQQLGASRRGQIIAALVVATLPMGILQATSTQTDYTVAFWLVCLVSFLLAFQSQPHWTNALAAGTALGLALLTKGTAYLFATPFLLWAGLWVFWKFRWQAYKPALLFAGPVPLLIVGPFVRNLTTFGHLLGPPDEVNLLPNTSFGPMTLISNVVRNLALHIGTTDATTNANVEHGITSFLGLLGINANDPATTGSGTTFHLNAFSTHEDYAGNPAHLLLFLLVFILCLSLSRFRQRDVLLYLAAVIGGGLLFCNYLKWTPWTSRLQLPIFVLFSALVGVVLDRLHPSVGIIVTLALVVCSWPWLVDNQSRPLLGSSSIFTTPRPDQYFANRPGLEGPYEYAVAIVQQSNCRNIGLAMGSDDWEYPLWVLLNPTGDPTIHIEQVNITSSTAHLEQQPAFKTFQPCAVITLNLTETRTFEANPQYTQAWVYGQMGVFLSPKRLPAAQEPTAHQIQEPPAATSLRVSSDFTNSWPLWFQTLAVSTKPLPVETGMLFLWGKRASRRLVKSGTGTAAGEGVYWCRAVICSVTEIYRLGPAHEHGYLAGKQGAGETEDEVKEEESSARLSGAR